MVDIGLPWGGDVTWTPQGTRVLVQDTPGNPAATQQQATVIVMTAPRPLDEDGSPIGRPDNLYYPDRGGGLAEMVGQNPVPAYLNALQNRILSALSTKTTIAATPLPTVEQSTNIAENAELDVLVTAYTTSGDVITISSSTSGASA